MTTDKYKFLSESVIYEIFVRNYSNAGTFNEIYNDLDRIKKLGANIIWFMPLNPNGKFGKKGGHGSPYSISDYFTINPEYGNEKQFSDICEKAHDLDMKVLIDVVFNHTSMDSVLLKSNPEWFLKDENGNFTRKFKDWNDIYDLDFSNLDLWDYLVDILKKWIDFGVDGFRCDVAPMIPLEFWKYAINKIGEYSSKSIIWLAESVHKSFIKFLRDKGFEASSDTELHQIFDITYDYDGFEILQKYFSGNALLNDYVNYLFIQETLYTKNSLKLRFLENHDCERISSIFEGKNKLKNWSLFFMLLPGTPLIYMGQELMINKLPNLFEKNSVRWNEGDYEFLNYYKKIISISKEIKKNCKFFKTSFITNGILKIDWEGEENYTAILNLEDKSGILETNLNISGIDLITGENFAIENIFNINKNPIILKL